MEMAMTFEQVMTNQGGSAKDLGNFWTLQSDGSWEPAGEGGAEKFLSAAESGLCARDFKDKSGKWKRVWIDARVIGADGFIPVCTVGWE